MQSSVGRTIWPASSGLRATGVFLHMILKEFPDLFTTLNAVLEESNIL